MASAVLASRNEPYWGESKVYKRKYTNNTTNNPNLSKFNPNPNPNPNPSSDSVFHRQSHDFQGKARLGQRNEPPQPKIAPPAAALERSLSLNRREISVNGGREWGYGEYVSFNLAEYSRAELKEIKKRLISDLQQVRSLRARIETRDVEPRSGYPVSGFSGGYGGGVVRPVTRPPPLQLSYAVGSNGAPDLGEKRTPKAKNKKVSGRGRHLGSGRDPKLQVAGLDSPVGKVVLGMLRRCKQMLTKLMKHKHSWVFNTPVDAVKLGLHDYHQIIKNPMDLGTVKSKLDKNEYGSPMDFASDVRLTFNNALTYNLKGHDVYIMADTLLKRFEEMFNPAYKKFEAEHHRVVAAAAAAEKTNQMARSVQPTLSNPIYVQPTLSNPPLLESGNPRLTQKLPKPKAKELNKRQMSFEEKAKLGINLQNLPQEKMDQLLQILKKRNPRLAQEGDEIELDIEALDTETLWELDRFANYHKRSVTKIIRQGLLLIDNSISEAQVNELPVNEPTIIPDAMVQKDKKVDFGEEDVDIGEEIPVSNFPPLEIEKDYGNGSSRSGSSSSSSSSGGSSTSSGSAGSSGSDSDAGESKDDAAVTEKSLMGLESTEKF